MCCGVSWGRAAADKKTYLRQIHALSLHDLWSEKERQSEKKTCFPPTVKWIFDFDKIFAGVCCCGVLFSENFIACFSGFLLRGLHFFRYCSSSMLTLTQYFFYSNLQEPLELQSDMYNASPVWEFHPRRSSEKLKAELGHGDWHEELCRRRGASN